MLTYVRRSCNICLVLESTAKLNKCDSGVVGNARPCQGRDRGFEPRLSLFQQKGYPEGYPFLLKKRQRNRSPAVRVLVSAAAPVVAKQRSPGPLATVYRSFGKPVKSRLCGIFIAGESVNCIYSKKEL